MKHVCNQMLTIREYNIFSLGEIIPQYVINAEHVQGHQREIYQLHIFYYINKVLLSCDQYMFDM